MPKTAFDLPKEVWRKYKPTQARPDKANDRHRLALDVAGKAAAILRRDFQAKRVLAFGSLADQQFFTQWSDIDLAVSGIKSEQFYRAVAAVTGFNAEFKIDLVDLEDCSSGLRSAVEAEGFEI